MKYRFRLSVYVLLITFVFINANQLFGQEKVIITSGVGFPELINIGVRYQCGQSQLGLSIGAVNVKVKFISISGDLFYHFDRLSNKPGINPCYCRVGLDYWKLDEFHAEGNFLLFNLRLGRDFNISHKFGTELDAGVVFHSKELLNQSGVAPSLGIRLFYKI